METNILSELSLKMLEVDSKDPIRRNVINNVKLGMDLHALQKIVNKGKSQGTWLKFVDQHFGKDKRPFCYRALALYRHQIPLEDLRRCSASAIYSDISRGIYRKYTNDPRQYWMKTFQMQNEIPIIKEGLEKSNDHRYVQKLSRQKSKDPNYNDRPNKDIIENYVINMGRQYFQENKVTCLTVVGQRYQKHINRLFASFAQSVYVFENDPKTLKSIREKMVHCPYSTEGRVTVVPLDASEITILDCPFIDLDIEGTFPNVTTTIQKHALAQKASHIDSPKIFAFTFASRGGRYGSSAINYQGLKDILSCFDVELIGFNGSIGNFGKKVNKSGGKKMPGAVIKHGNTDKEIRNCMKHDVNCKPMSKDITIFDIVYFTYNDSQGPMGHMTISYS
jgi:hypothetical protein